jgi:hypothetical protein
MRTSSPEGSTLRALTAPLHASTHVFTMARPNPVEQAGAGLARARAAVHAPVPHVSRSRASRDMVETRW